MADDRSLPSPAGDSPPALPAETGGQAPLPYAGGGGGYYLEEEEEQGLDFRRYMFALLRYKWLLIAAVVVGVAGAAAAWKLGNVGYTAEGNLWVEVEGQQTAGDVSPIRAGGLLESNAWVELLRSFAVLDSVVVSEQLYVQAPEEWQGVFASFALADTIVPGKYELLVGPDGRAFQLSFSDGVLVQQGQLGEPIGGAVGMDWTPQPGAFPAGAEVPFTVLGLREAASNLNARLVTSMDPQGNFIGLELSGTQPRKLASVLNALMERHVKLAAELTHAKLEETREILEEQLRYTDAELAQAERDLEEFRVVTITLPSDRSTPITPGLEVTRDPVFGNFFNMKVDVEQLRRDRARLEDVIASFPTTGVRIEALEVIPAAAQSTELRVVLNELVEARSELRALRERYADDYPPVQDALAAIETLEQQTIPGIARGIVSQLAVQESQMQALVDSASDELAAIPPRTIEEGRLRRRVAIQETLYNELRSRVETARLAAASSIPDVRILDRAAVPRIPTNDTRLRWAILVLLGCVGGAVGGVLVLDRVDKRFRYAADVSRDIGLDLLGSIPRIEMGKRGQKGALNAAQALEAFRELRIHVGFAYGSAGPLTLTVSSPSEGEGKSLISSNLAVAFAEVGRRTLLIDGDTRRGDAHRLLGRQRSPGLIDYLRERSSHDIIQTTDIHNLDFIGSGSRGTSTPELLASPRMAFFMGTLKRSYDVIIVDSPPLASGGDPLILSSLTGNLAVVIRTGATEKQLAQAKLDQLSRLPIRVLGAILNDVDPSRTYDYHYTSYLPSYEPLPEGEDEEGGVQLLSGRRSQAS